MCIYVFLTINLSISHVSHAHMKNRFYFPGAIVDVQINVQHLLLTYSQGKITLNKSAS